MSSSGTLLQVTFEETSHDLRCSRIAQRPATLAQAGLSEALVADLIAKHLASAGVLPLSRLIERIALAGTIVEQVLSVMRREARVEVRARIGSGPDMHFGLTERGRADALDAMLRSGYVGPAPVPVDSYTTLVRKQPVRAESVSRASLRRALRDVVISEELLDKLGPAMNCGRALFIYGLPGTGKTFIARQLARALAGVVLVPHAIAVDDIIIPVFDPLTHFEVQLTAAQSPIMLQQGFDPRYVCCERPLVVSSGELSAEMLEVQFDPIKRCYSAPLQLKANGGLLLVDDLGRQRIRPDELFNRWIVAMEEGRDFLSAGGGRHFTVPFDLVLVFATNLDPKVTADEAFLRRIGYKIEFNAVPVDQYKKIWADYCERRDVEYDSNVVDYVIHELYAKHGMPLLPCHPRDLLGMALDYIAYHGQGSVDAETLRWAWENYFARGEA